MNSLNNLWCDDVLMEAAGLPGQEFPEGALYVVGVPIGNMGDITLRALWVLSRVDAVAAEDTRETRKLLERFGIEVRQLSVREHNERHGAEQIEALLREGKRVALVTDAGTPAISDPGARAVAVLREAGFRIIPIPGPSAVVTALSAAGLTGQGFTFIGFLPPQGRARREALETACARREPFVLYEAPHRITDLLKELGETLSPGRKVVVARELTKKFETVISLNAAELPQYAMTHEPRGEYVVIMDEEPPKEEGLSPADEAWLRDLAPELPASRLAAIAARRTGRPRQEIYSWLIRLRDDQTDSQ
ncbi:16S rRNA (cytidine(1402)-2'-O)-methyltransferase [Sutterella sp.]|uniref:16S rRNA (cytidine(1402)-2'-O)-methyltransferase n=1 Tax=Sutterella sp. TaxID=1981025 RepID=UPI0026DED3A3|nr:16S rRNA (cytidine(1402)-2'-O)-methyltransferase [Sutterella sp.]MDO5532785.1 16S rRNA (cytidine(1402)-2'-O)-methyltransferase [Sutterella sp.]